MPPSPFMSRTTALLLDYWAQLRNGDWLDGHRARAYLNVLAAISVVAAVAYIAASSHGIDLNGKPVGTDFASFWTASQIALSGQSAAVWDVPTHAAAQAALFGPDAGYAAFFYPPTYLLVCLPLALAPYAASLALWLAATGAAWVRVVKAWAGPDIGWLPILAFPAVLLTVGHGQNAFLTAALFGAGALMAERRPWLAGALFGALIVKPHLGVFIPLFLIFTGNWRGFLGAGLSATGLCLLSLAAFGPHAWLNFLEASTLARTALEQDMVGYAKMQSAFAGVRLMGGSVPLAWAVQAATAVAGAVGLWTVRHRSAGLGAGAVLACATLVATPFLLDYDLTLLAIPLAWLMRQALRDGFRPWDKLVLLAAFVLPLAARPLGLAAHLPVTTLVVLALMACIVRRCTAEPATRVPA